MVASALWPRILRSVETCTCRLFSSTTTPGHTVARRSSFAISVAGRSTNAASRSNARAPIATGVPSASRVRSLGRNSKRPKRRGMEGEANSGALRMFGYNPDVEESNAVRLQRVGTRRSDAAVRNDRTHAFRSEPKPNRGRRAPLALHSGNLRDDLEGACHVRGASVLWRPLNVLKCVLNGAHLF